MEKQSNPSPNPFKQFIEGEPVPGKAMEKEVTETIRNKSFLAEILSFFTAVLGVTFWNNMTGSGSQREEPNQTN